VLDDDAALVEHGDVPADRAQDRRPPVLARGGVGALEAGQERVEPPERRRRPRAEQPQRARPAPARDVREQGVRDRDVEDRVRRERGRDQLVRQSSSRKPILSVTW
jgi:hypothetical protein